MYGFRYLANLERHMFAKSTFHSQFGEKAIGSRNTVRQPLLPFCRPVSEIVGWPSCRINSWQPRTFD
jgi:hypothetical protein